MPAGAQYIASEARILTTTKIEFRAPGAAPWSLRHHSNTLYIYKPTWGKTLSEVTFSHPRLLVNMLPSLRQFVFLSTLLENTFGSKIDPQEPSAGNPPATINNQTTTRRDEFAAFMEAAGRGTSTDRIGDSDMGSAERPLKIDVTLNVHPVPRLQVVFPFRSGTATVDLEIQENGQVHIESQNILDESNKIGPNGRERRPEDIGKLLEMFENIGEVVRVHPDKMGISG